MDSIGNTQEQEGGRGRSGEGFEKIFFFSQA